MGMIILYVTLMYTLARANRHSNTVFHEIALADENFNACTFRDCIRNIVFVASSEEKYTILQGSELINCVMGSLTCFPFYEVINQYNRFLKSGKKSFVLLDGKPYQILEETTNAQVVSRNTLEHDFFGIFSQKHDSGLVMKRMYSWTLKYKYFFIKRAKEYIFFQNCELLSLGNSVKNIKTQKDDMIIDKKSSEPLVLCTSTGVHLMLVRKGVLLSNTDDILYGFGKQSDIFDIPNSAIAIILSPISRDELDLNTCVLIPHGNNYSMNIVPGRFAIDFFRDSRNRTVYFFKFNHKYFISCQSGLGAVAFNFDDLTSSTNYTNAEMYYLKIRNYATEISIRYRC